MIPHGVIAGWDAKVKNEDSQIISLLCRVEGLGFSFLGGLGFRVQGSKLALHHGQAGRNEVGAKEHPLW